MPRCFELRTLHDRMSMWAPGIANPSEGTGVRSHNGVGIKWSNRDLHRVVGVKRGIIVRRGVFMATSQFMGLEIVVRFVIEGHKGLGRLHHGVYVVEDVGREVMTEIVPTKIHYRPNQKRLNG